MDGLFYDPDELFNFEQIVYQYVHVYGVILQLFIYDTDTIVREAVANGKKIILEGAQGDLLSIDYGTYPYVTSSDASLEGLAKGCGLRTEDVDLDLGIIKGFYMTRVGGGPFISEMGGIMSQEHCDVYSREDEEKLCPTVNLNSSKEITAGIAVRKKRSGIWSYYRQTQAHWLS
jgi:adenylosuccinate synthase